MTITQLFDRKLGDARVVAIFWEATDIVISFELPASGSEQLQLRFEAVSHLRIDIDFGELAGQPLLWAAEATPVGESGWEVSLDFGGASDGVIAFKCTDIRESWIPQ